MENPNNINNDELKKLAPELFKLEKKDPFAVPPEYFDDFTLRLQNRMNQKKKTHSPWFYYILKPKYSVAISLCIIMIVSGVFYYNYTQKQAANNNDVYWDEVIGDNNTINYNFDENSLAETLADLSPETEAEILINSDQNIKSISTEDLDDYIKSNNNDVFYEN